MKKATLLLFFLLLYTLSINVLPSKRMWERDISDKTASISAFSYPTSAVNSGRIFLIHL